METKRTDPSSHRLAVSVALCTYNGARFVAAQLRSILAQSRPPDEVVICDDGSSDDTVAVVERIRQDTGANIRLFVNRENLGFVRNFERAIGLCEGDIVFLSDQDDVWVPERIETMLEPFLEDDRVCLAYSDAEIVDADLKPLGTTVFGTRRVARLRDGNNRAIAEVVLHPDLKGCLTAHRSSWKSVFWPMPAAAQESGWGHDHWLAVIAHAAGKVRAIDRVLMSYRVHGANSGQDPLVKGRPSLAGKIAQSLRLSRTSQGDVAAVTDTMGAKLRPMLDRLKEIGTHHVGVPLRMETLNNYIAELEEAVLAAGVRSDLRNRSRLRRLSGMFRMLRKGWYAKYYAGVWSFLRDTLVR
jgi:glycosyltransferase involved in cell wall biosynthesis